MNKLLTISIAAYNVESYIAETLDSLLNGNQVGKLEIFVVDDGGTDKTLSIAKEYEKKYPNIVYAVHKENGGYGTTVNWSIEHASGRFFKLLDGDDWVNEVGFSHLLDLLEYKTNCDAIINPYSEGPNKTCQKIVRRNWSGRFGNEYSLSELDNDQIPMWCITYKTETLRRSRLELPSKFLYTDYLYSVIPFSYVNKVYFDSMPVYGYRIGRAGQSISWTSRINHFPDIEQISCDLCRFANQQIEKGESCFFSYRAAGACRFALVSLLLRPSNAESLKMIKNYDNQINSLSSDVYDKMTELGKFGLMINALRKSNYLFYKLVSAITKKYF